MNTEINNSKLTALYRLSQEGVGNERTTAERMLKKHLADAGLSIDGFINEKPVVRTHEFSYDKKSPFDRDLLIQIFSQVIDAETYFTYKRNSNGHKVAKLGIECTSVQAAEVFLRQTIYRDALNDELQLTFEAFIIQNSITRNSSDDHTDDEMDLEHLERLMSRMSSIPPTPVAKQIEQDA